MQEEQETLLKILQLLKAYLGENKIELFSVGMLLKRH
jgi:hypothetical protein